MASGHLRKRSLKNGKNSWQLTIEIGVDPVTGKRQRIFETIKGGTKKEAERRMRKIITDIEQNEYIAPQNITVEAFMIDWLETYKIPYISPKTVEQYKGQVYKYIIPLLGKKKLQSLKTIEVQKFYNEIHKASPISGKPLSAATVRKIHLNLKAALNKAVDLELIKKNPAKTAVLPKAKRFKPHIYEGEETRQLLEAVRGTDLEVPINLLVGLGLRRGELLGLRWKDVDFDNKRVHIRQNLIQLQNTKLHFKEPKTESSIREIALSNTLVKLLRQQYVKICENKLRFGEEYKDHDLVICKENGEPMNPNSFSQKFRRKLKREGLRHIRVHDLRHTNATLMLDAGISPKVAQERLGHASIATTMDIYSHVTSSLEQEAAKKLEESVFSKIG
ncbi:site-specific integrase [Vallitalea okinawensis]|uniref:site-specific integrase n=1 Tax=Vallitalea okinawensis TaxID=2078660 RepID=UPI000CFB36EC|nr:site-specific integrase [Vallitalea okinawensis]